MVAQINQIWYFLFSPVSNCLSSLLDLLPEGGEAPVGVGDHLVLVARHQPLKRVPDYEELQVVFINQLELVPVLIKTVQCMYYLCRICRYIYNDNSSVRGSISNDRASGTGLLVRWLVDLSSTGWVQDTTWPERAVNYLQTDFWAIIGSWILYSLINQFYKFLRPGWTDCILRLNYH